MCAIQRRAIDIGRDNNNINSKASIFTGLCKEKEIILDKSLALLHALADGLTGYMTYESRCGMSQAYSEYLLYGPIVRIANHLGWQVESEWPHTRSDKPKGTRGDYERIDFLFRHKKDADAGWVAIEVKWALASKQKPDMKKDIKKLREAIQLFSGKNLQGFLLVAGPHEISEPGDPVLKSGIKKLPENTRLLFSNAYKAKTGIGMA